MHVDPNAIDIGPARIPQDLPGLRLLFEAYADSLGIDLSFQDFDSELATLPGKYAPPEGRLLLARDGTVAVACVALRRIDPSTAEMKRLYVSPKARGGRLGRRLVEQLIAEAKAAGYGRICLDTLPTMRSAQALYVALGFRDVDPYVFNPIAGARFMALELG